MPKQFVPVPDATLERAHLQLTDIEKSLEVENVSAEGLIALNSDFQLFRRQFLDDFGDYEIMALGAQILDVELKLMELKADECRHH